MPERVMRQNTLVKHVRIGDEHSRIFTDFGALLGGRIAIINGSFYCRIQSPHVLELVLSQRFGGEEI